MRRVEAETVGINQQRLRTADQRAQDADPMSFSSAALGSPGPTPEPCSHSLGVKGQGRGQDLDVVWEAGGQAAVKVGSERRAAALSGRYEAAAAARRRAESNQRLGFQVMSRFSKKEKVSIVSIVLVWVLGPETSASVHK